MDPFIFIRIRLFLYGSGSISRANGFTDPDPYQNETNLKHWSIMTSIKTIVVVPIHVLPNLYIVILDPNPTLVLISELFNFSLIIYFPLSR